MRKNDKEIFIQGLEILEKKNKSPFEEMKYLGENLKKDQAFLLRFFVRMARGWSMQPKN
jgi:hypothetical protein